MSSRSCNNCGREIKFARKDGKVIPIERVRALQCMTIDGEEIATDVLGEYWQNHYQVCSGVVRRRPSSETKYWWEDIDR
jgi:hypothetical protein